MKREKLVMISCIVLFVISTVLFAISNSKSYSKEEKQEADIENSVLEETKENEMLQQFTEAPESSFRFGEVEFAYFNTDLDIKAILEENNQLNYFQFTLYDYLCERGYEDIKEIKVTEGRKTVDNIQFRAYVKMLQNDKEFGIDVDYDTKLLAFYYHFANEEVDIFPVDIIGVNEQLSEYIGADFNEIEREFGKYLYEQKMDATQADIKWFEVQEDKLVIQVELNDEYLTYCKIYYDLVTREFEFKKWG